MGYIYTIMIPHEGYNTSLILSDRHKGTVILSYLLNINTSQGKAWEGMIWHSTACILEWPTWFPLLVRKGGITLYVWVVSNILRVSSWLRHIQNRKCGNAQLWVYTKNNALWKFFEVYFKKCCHWIPHNHMLKYKNQVLNLSAFEYWWPLWFTGILGIIYGGTSNHSSLH